MTIPPLWTYNDNTSFAQLRDAKPLRGVKKKEDVLSATRVSLKGSPAENTWT